MSRKRTGNRRLSVYLIKEEHNDFNRIAKGDAKQFEVTYGGRIIGVLYVKPVLAHRPSWFSLFDGSVAAGVQELLNSRNASAVLLLKHKGRIFAITFGYGRSLLEPGIWEERFGLRVVLNSIDPERIRVIERKNLDTMLTHTRTQTSRECAIGEFNLDVQQMLLKAVTGEPRDKAFATCMSGADALSITCQTTLDTLETKCGELLKAFAANDYKKIFPWVNNINEVKNRTKTEELNEELVGRIKDGKTERLFLAVPDMVDWTEIDGFKFREDDDEALPDILLSSFLQTVRDSKDISCQYLRQRRVFLVHSETGVIESKWSVFHCLNCEIADARRTYILTEGKWYEVNPSFVAQVNERIGRIDKRMISMPAGKSEKEADYCCRLYKSNRTRYALMDQKIIRYGGGQSQIEFCDLFTKDGKLIHIKRYSGSSVLSHLFTQGTNCARAFLADVEFRRKINAKLPASHRIVADQQPAAKDWEIVFGIISETAGDLPNSLPFFSKITLMRASQELREIMGFKMSLAGIRVA